MSPQAKPPAISVRDLCARLKVEPPAGIEDRLLDGVSTLRNARPSQLAYVQKEKYAQAAHDSEAGLLLVTAKVKVERTDVVYLADVMDGVLTALEYFHPDPAPLSYIDSSASVAASVQLGKDVFIGPNAVIEDDVVLGDRVRVEAFAYIGAGTVIGEETRLMPRVSIMHGTEIGRRVLILSGAVIGADGFRFETTRGRLCKVPQIGRVVIEDDVEIGANTTIDRASLTETRVGARSKIDNAVHIGHNVVMGPDCIIVAHVGIAGSVRIGRGVMIGGAAGIKDHIELGDGCRIAGRSAVQHNVPAGVEVIGSPAIPLKDYVRFSYFYKNFAEQWGKVKALLKEKAEKDSRQ